VLQRMKCLRREIVLTEYASFNEEIE
jgi:hypothetical protein